MNKALAEILAGVIPCKLARNQWRGRLRYGLLNMLRLKRRMAADKTEPRYYLAVCAVAKNEGPYFKEWVEWHLRQGVEHFYIYDNESTDETRQALEPYIASGVVDYTYWPGRRQQLATYDDCLERHRTDARWIAFIDLDEFILPIKDKSIPDFLRRMEPSSVVEINWLCYGSGGARKKEPGGIIERFHHHSQPGHILNRHVKSIVDPRRVCCMIGCHEAARIGGTAVDPHGERIARHFRNREPQQDVIRINHYAVKSYEEFLAKRERGRARGRQEKRDLEYFDRYDLNDICEE